MKLRLLSSVKLGSLALVIIAMCLLRPFNVAEAQSELHTSATLIHKDNELSLLHFGWADDGSLIKLQTDSGNLVYDLSGKKLSNTLVPVPTLTLPLSKLVSLGIKAQNANYPRVIYSISPDGKFIIYNSMQEVGDANVNDPLEYCTPQTVHIADVKDGKQFTSVIVIDVGLQFVWVSDTSVIVVTARQGSNCIAYMPYTVGYMANIRIVNAQLIADEMSRDQELYYGSNSVILRDIFDTSAVPTRFLVSGRDATSNELLAGIVDATNTKRITVFLQGEQYPIELWWIDAERVAVINKNGFSIYNSSTERFTVIDPTFAGYYDILDGDPIQSRTSFITRASVSPDKKYLLYSVNDNLTGTVSLYSLDLRQILSLK